jgi:hypothetical protein
MLSWAQEYINAKPMNMKIGITVENAQTECKE